MAAKTKTFILAVFLLMIASLNACAPEKGQKVPVSQVRVYFSPQGGCTEAIVAEINKAISEIRIQAYSFTSMPIAKAVADAGKRNVRVEIILDKSNRSDRYSAADFTAHHGIPTYIDDKHNIAHNKIMIIDRKIVVTGSFNFTNQAEHENAENLMIIKGHPELVQAYRQNFLAHKAHSKAAEMKTPVDAHRAKKAA